MKANLLTATDERLSKKNAVNTLKELKTKNKVMERKSKKVGTRLSKTDDAHSTMNAVVRERDSKHRAASRDERSAKGKAKARKTKKNRELKTKRVIRKSRARKEAKMAKIIKHNERMKKVDIRHQAMM